MFLYVFICFCMVLLVLPHHAECQRIGTNNKNIIQYLAVGKHRSKKRVTAVTGNRRKNCIFRQKNGKNAKSVEFALPALPCRTNLASYCLDVV